MTSPVVEKSTSLESRFVAAFEMHDGQSLNGSNASLRGVRKAAIERFKVLGFPTMKAEAWKYTKITKLMRRDYRLHFGGAEEAVSAENIGTMRIPGMDAHLVVLVNGQFSERLSDVGTLPEGVRVMSLAKAAEAHAALFNAHFAKHANFENEVFTALNTAFARDGVFVYVPKNTTVEQPVQVLNLITADEPLLVQPRALFIAEPGSSVKLVTTHNVLGDAQTFSNVVTEVFVGANAHVDLYELQDEGAHASQVTNLQAYQERDSVFRTSTFTFSGEVVRNNLSILPDGENCDSHLYGLFLGRGSSHVDNHTVVDHAKPQCISNELFKNILDDNAVGVFNGRVLVRQDAQQINAYQKNKSIVLTDTAKMYSKPELEIYADDVQCSHGATTGQLDDEAIFYLRSRGLTEARARALMLTAFARDVVDTVALEPLREMIDARIEARFSE